MTKKVNKIKFQDVLASWSLLWTTTIHEFCVLCLSFDWQILVKPKVSKFSFSSALLCYFHFGDLFAIFLKVRVCFRISFSSYVSQLYHGWGMHYWVVHNLRCLYFKISIKLNQGNRNFGTLICIQLAKLCKYLGHVLLSTFLHPQIICYQNSWDAEECSWYVL